MGEFGSSRRRGGICEGRVCLSGVPRDLWAIWAPIFRASSFCPERHPGGFSEFLEGRARLSWSVSDRRVVASELGTSRFVTRRVH